MPSFISSSKFRAEYDARLIPMSKDPSDRLFLALIAGVTFALACMWNVALPFAPRTYPALNQAEENRARIVDYALSPPPDVVFSGSSLTYRLLPPYFTSLDVRNVSLAGGSPVTGAEIASRRPPRVMVVEINILDRAPREDIVAQAERALRPPMGIPALAETTTPVRAAVATAFRLDAYQSAWTAAIRKRVDAVLAQPALAYTPAPTEAVEAWKSRPLIAQTAASASTLKRILDDIEAAGGKGFYLQMPIDAGMAATVYASSGRKALEAIDPKFEERLVTIEWSKDLRWSDGTHLDDRSAIIVAHQLERFIQSRTKRDLR